MSYYTAFEVMECSWAELTKRLDRSENLDEVIDAHEEFLNNVIRRALLSDNTKELLTQLRAIYDRVVEFDALQSRLYSEAMSMAESRKNQEAMSKARGKRASQMVDEDDLERQRAFAMETMPKLETNLKIVSQSYQDMVRTFLLQLTVSQDQSLQCLSFRLDFNTHYKRKDARLGTPLTFQHRNLRDEYWIVCQIWNLDLISLNILIFVKIYSELTDYKLEEYSILFFTPLKKVYCEFGGLRLLSGCPLYSTSWWIVQGNRLRDKLIGCISVWL